MNIFFTKIEHVHIYLLSTNIVYVVYELCICETIRIFSFFFANLAWFFLLPDNIKEILHLPVKTLIKNWIILEEGPYILTISPRHAKKQLKDISSSDKNREQDVVNTAC